MKKILCILFFPMVIFAQKNDSFAIKIDEVVCTAQMTPTDARQAIHSIKVINEQVIARRAVNNLEELLQGEVNFRFSSDLVLGNGLQINGVGGENVKVLIDGVPVIGRLNGNVDLSQIPLHNVARVEVVQGSLSAIYGSNASGGVINVITKKSQIKPFSLELKTQYENVSIKTASAQLGLQKGKFLFRVGANIYDFAGYPADSLRTSVWNPKKQLAYNTSLKYRINENNSISYTYNALDETVTNLGELKRPNFKPYAFDDYYHTIRNDHSLNYEGLVKKTNLQSTLAYNNFLREKNSYRKAIQENTQDLIDGQQDTSRFNAILWRNTFSRVFSPKNTLIGGTEFYYENAQGQKIQDSTETKRNFAQIADFALFLGVKSSFFDEKLKIQPTVRYSYNTKYNAPLTPSVNLIYGDEHWKMRAGYAYGFRAPSLKELYFNFIDVNHYIVGSKDIKAEKSNNFSLNPSYTNTYGKTSLSIDGNFFYNDIKNRIILVQYDAVILKYHYANLAEYKTKGAGLNLALNYDEKVILKSGLLYTGYYNTGRDEHPELPVYLYSPEMSSDLTISPFHKPLSINVLYRYTGKMPTYSMGKDQRIQQGNIAAWSMLNTSVSYSFFKNKIQLVAGAKNILNVRQVATQGALNVGHNAGAGEIPVNFGRSYFAKAVFKIG
jgi:outer membrane receptor for ferrienterochelin and colicins